MTGKLDDRFVPFDREIYENYQISSCVGGLVSSWDKAEFVGAEEAHFLRDDDYVIGLKHNGVVRAYPIWVVDYYHVINDMVGGDPIMFVTCERCQSGSAFIARGESGKRLKFYAAGFYGATLTICDRDGFLGGDSGIWLHYNAVAIHGRYLGTQLEQVPTFHHSWADWRALHPDTDVMLPPDNPDHPDGRLDHGRDEYFCRPGMEMGAAQTINGLLDDQYPENELILGLYAGKEAKAYPLREVKKAGGVVEESIDGVDLVVFSGPAPDQATLSAYHRRVNNQTLSFFVKDGHFVDQKRKASGI